MSYRVETASTGRAGCTSTECKAANIKIDKDELRLGWVSFKDHESWKWRHWGCVTGKVLEGIRTFLADPDAPGTYRWDALDGYDSEGVEKNSLEKHPDLQEKVRRCITQGFIDAEDFNGDPEMNVLGAVGLRTKEGKKKIKDDQKARTHEFEEMRAQIAALQDEVAMLRANGATVPKREAASTTARADLNEQLAGGSSTGKKRVKDEADEDEATPAKKKRATKKNLKADPEDDEDEATPAKKKRATKKNLKADPEDDEDVKPAKVASKPRAKKGVKKEEDSDEAAEVKPPPAKKPRAKKGAKKGEDTEISGAVDQRIKDEEDADAPAVVSAPKKGASSKKAVKAEPADQNAGIDPVVKSAKVKPASKKSGNKAVKNEPMEEPALAHESKPGMTEGSSMKTHIPEQGEAEATEEDLSAVAIARNGERSGDAADKVKDP
ncbi:hypothetical protein MBM_07643 [Drepanopeziza brunnea f. sp. 'multigermtubi' MB_m1]|uniref:PARP-type domain-containing protein n=1 Tax=Marssonina brunnea f. sp. multigermtubi (strain MB_m1) TaxID=1072389 RepID=K1X0L4_MARBU|nr:uncharacterized protein MBM_07643 [Drepanopeziza brunnea f. sp. 'multigermtubi' MB_m1]EKD14413.1 hypothetical protein MBM_07643 [Drepanopeziza brunnea f. sp. 'multigermtubi' MB_m1]